MPAGVVHRWFEDKGYGFIKPTDGGADVFVHVKGLLSADFLQIGDQVTFETKLNKGKEVAMNVVGGRKKAGTATLDQTSDKGEDESAVRAPEKTEKARGRKDEVASTEYQPMSVTRVDLQTPQELEVNLAQVACLQEIPGERDRCWMLYSTAVKAPERVAFEDDGTGEIDPLVGEPVGPKVLHAVQALGSYRDLKRAIERVSGGDWREVTRAQGMIITPRGLVLQRRRVVHEKLLVNFHFVAHTNKDLGGCEVVFLNIHLPPRLDILEAQIKHVGEEMEKLQYEQEQIKGDVAALGEEVQRQARERELRALAFQQQQRWQKMERLRVTVRRAVRTRRTSSVRGDCLPYIVLLPSADVLASGRFSQPTEPEQPEPELEPCPAGRTCRTYPNCDRYHASLPSRTGAAAPRKVLCRFGDNCAKYPDCGFHHAQPPVLKTVQVAIDKRKTECMHGDACKKWPQCEYLHTTVPAGKLCSYGDACLRYPNCGYHHERPPQGAGSAGGAFAKGAFAKGAFAKGGFAQGGFAQGGKGGKRGTGMTAGLF